MNPEKSSSSPLNTAPGYFPADKISGKVQKIPPSGIRVFFDIVAQRKDVISLGVGEPDFSTPQIIVDEAIASLRNGQTYYTSNQGMPSLRKAIASHLESKHDLSYNPNTEMIITVGVSEGIDLAFRSILNPGDGVLFPAPCYVSYSPLVEIIGGVTQKITTYAEDNFKIREEEIEKAINSNNSKTKVLFLNYPANPTGATYTREELEVLRKFVLKHDLLVITDEIYSGLTYDHEHVPMSALPDMKNRTIHLGGFSKTYAMTGWRIGYAAGPAEWIQPMLKIHQYCMLCAPTMSQFAAQAALEYGAPEALRMKDEYIRRREFIVAEFNRLGLKTNMPGGAFFVFPDIRSSGLSSTDFAHRLLNEQDVAVIPGVAFGDEGEGFIRCSYATAMEDLKTAVQKIERFLGSL